MFCGRCGTQNADTAAFCAGCGAPLQQNPPQPMYEPQPSAAPQQPDFYPPQQTMPQQPEFYAQQSGYYPQPASAKNNKKLLTIIGIAAAAVAVVIVLILLLGGGSGYSDPEDAALAFAEGSLTGDWSQAESAIHPEMIDEDMEEEFDEVCEYLEAYGVEVDDVEVEKCRDMDDDELDNIAEEIEDDYGLEISDAKRVKISYSMTMWGSETSGSEEFVVVEIDGDWYAYGD